MSFTTRYRNGQKLDVELWVTLKRTAVSNSEMIISCCGARDFFFLPNVRNIFSSRLRFRFFYAYDRFFSNDIEAGIGYLFFFSCYGKSNHPLSPHIFTLLACVCAQIYLIRTVWVHHTSPYPSSIFIFSSGETLCVRTRSTYLPSMTGSTFLQIEKKLMIFFKKSTDRNEKN